MLKHKNAKQVLQGITLPEVRPRNVQWNKNWKNIQFLACCKQFSITHFTHFFIFLPFPILVPRTNCGHDVWTHFRNRNILEINKQLMYSLNTLFVAILVRMCSHLSDKMEAVAKTSQIQLVLSLSYGYDIKFYILFHIECPLSKVSYISFWSFAFLS